MRGLAGVVMLALAPQAAPQEVLTQRQIDNAIDLGSSYLARRYEQILAARPETGERNGQVALSLYTLLKTDPKPDEALVRKLLLELSTQTITGTYDAACALLALSAHDAVAHRSWIDDLADQLVGWQLPEGDWSYPSGGADLSNTQFAALGLWAASRAGREVDARVWTRLVQATLRYQAEDGGFAYSVRGGSTLSMTAAGIGTLAVCEARLRRANAFDRELAERAARARERGLEWAAANYEREPPLGTSNYALYGIERLGAFLNLARMGARDWYEIGARQLLAEQKPSGAWENGADPPTTCFALLFLKRATLERGPATGSASDEPPTEAPLRLAISGDDLARVAIAGWNRKVVHDLEWPRERGLGPHVAYVEYYVDGELAAVELGSPNRPAGRASFPSVVAFRKNGARAVKVRAVVRMPTGEEKTLESPEVAVTVAHALPAWRDKPQPPRGANLVPQMGASARASSHLKGSASYFERDWAPGNAVDGNPRTPWLALPEDEERELTLNFPRGREARVIQVYAAVLEPLGPEYLSRPVAIAITVNGHESGTLAMSPDPLQPMRLVLESPTQVKRLTLRITAVAKSPSSPIAGIGEVELFQREP